MRNSWGNHITVTLFGESHGEAIGCVVDGLPAGIKLNEAFILKQLDKRKPKGTISTSRQEADLPHYISGVYQQCTTGAPLTILFENANQQSKDYSQLQYLPRPSHADYPAYVKYHGANDPRGGGHFSGRLTTPLVAAGAIAMDLLEKKGIRIASHIQSLQDIIDDSFSTDPTTLSLQMEQMNDTYFAVLNQETSKKMMARIEEARLRQDSVGGTLQTMVVGMPVGIGEPWFDSLEGMLSHALFSIGGVKGVSFGSGFSITKLYGSQANDPWQMEQGAVVSTSNHSGGINGGISNGMPIVMNIAVKPTPSIFQTQSTVNLKTMENSTLSLTGRHDPAIIHRVRVVVDSMVALTLLDMITGVYGTEYWR